MPYADKDNLIADYLSDAKSTKEQDAIGRILDSVSSFVDTYCRRAPGYFNPASNTPSMKRVWGEGRNFLRLPMHVLGSVESVTKDGNVIDEATYYESDKNFWLYFEDYRSFCPSVWQDGHVYKVTARWGYDATPADLQEAVRQIVVQFWNVNKGIFGQITPTDFVISHAIPPTAKLILDKYKRREFEV